MQTALELGATQDGPVFPTPLYEKVRPRHIDDFAGLEEAKRIFKGLTRSPRPCAFLLIGPPGVGKTTMGMALAEDLPGTLFDISSQRADVATFDSLQDRFAYYPSRGKFWVPVVNEADQMTEKAQLRCLSLLDSSSWLRPKLGGGFEQGVAPPVIWVFTCNGLGANQTGIPPVFEKRFLSRCMVLKFAPLGTQEVAAYLLRIWVKECGKANGNAPDFLHLAQGYAGANLRDALMKLEMHLLAAAA